MNIKEAKRIISETFTIYTSRDIHGKLSIPLQRQRPIYLIGPPGIGKTDIVRQVAKELEIGFLDYSMTHHTRQSVIGLPIITDFIYDGVKHKKSIYTMSEVIGAIYEYIQNTGLKKGILFLDEINNVSETLHPTMLQLLQQKKIGKFKLPKDWILVCAGNPPLGIDLRKLIYNQILKYGKSMQ